MLPDNRYRCGFWCVVVLGVLVLVLAGKGQARGDVPDPFVPDQPASVSTR
jgi:hypothetical protein